jgi:hypothetical protein
VFKNVVVGFFLSVFYLEIYQNNFFYFLNIIFDNNTKNNLKI